MENVLSEFLNRPREVHSVGYGLMLTYLGLFHGLTVPGTQQALSQLALGIGVVLLGVTPGTVRTVLSGFLPEGTEIPADIRKEAPYFWLGITAVYAALHLATSLNL